MYTIYIAVVGENNNNSTIIIELQSMAIRHILYHTTVNPY